MTKTYKPILIEDYGIVVDENSNNNATKGLNYNFGTKRFETLDYDYDKFTSEWKFFKKVIGSIGKRLEGVSLIELPEPVEYNYDALGELRINEALVAFEEKHGYQLQTKDDRDKKYKETGKGGDYLYYLHHSFEDHVLVLSYGEHTPHDCSYYVTLELPMRDLVYPKLKQAANTNKYSEEDMRKAFYDGRVIKRMENNQPIFAEPTFNGYLRTLQKQPIPTEEPLRTNPIL